MSASSTRDGTEQGQRGIVGFLELGLHQVEHGPKGRGRGPRQEASYDILRRLRVARIGQGAEIGLVRSFRTRLVAIPRIGVIQFAADVAGLAQYARGKRLVLEGRARPRQIRRGVAPFESRRRIENEESRGLDGRRPSRGEEHGARLGIGVVGRYRAGNDDLAYPKGQSPGFLSVEGGADEEETRGGDEEFGIVGVGSEAPSGPSERLVPRSEGFRLETAQQDIEPIGGIHRSVGVEKRQSLLVGSPARIRSLARIRTDSGILRIEREDARDEGSRLFVAPVRYRASGVGRSKARRPERACARGERAARASPLLFSAKSERPSPIAALQASGATARAER